MANSISRDDTTELIHEPKACKLTRGIVAELDHCLGDWFSDTIEQNAQLAVDQCSSSSPQYVKP